jgi:hypothetical protein
MIAILISAVLCQSTAFDTGAKIRHESNKMIMGMQGVDYETADVLNGSNLTVDQARVIAAQRRQAAIAQINRDMAAVQKQTRETIKNVVKSWATLNEMFGRIERGEMTFPADKVEPARGMIRTCIGAAAPYAENKLLPRNVRTAAKAHIKKAEAAMTVLEKQNPGIEPGK